MPPQLLLGTSSRLSNLAKQRPGLSFVQGAVKTFKWPKTASTCLPALQCEGLPPTKLCSHRSTNLDRILNVEEDIYEVDEDEASPIDCGYDGKTAVYYNYDDEECTKDHAKKEGANSLPCDRTSVSGPVITTRRPTKEMIYKLPESPQVTKPATDLAQLGDEGTLQGIARLKSLYLPPPLDDTDVDEGDDSDCELWSVVDEDLDEQLFDSVVAWDDLEDEQPVDSKQQSEQHPGERSEHTKQHTKQHPERETQTELQTEQQRVQRADQSEQQQPEQIHKQAVHPGSKTTPESSGLNTVPALPRRIHPLFAAKHGDFFKC